VPRRATAALLVLAAIAVSAPFAAGYLLPQHGFVLIGLAAFAGYSPYALTVVLAVAAGVRQWPLTLALAAGLVAQVAVLAPAYVRDDSRSGPRLVVMTTNAFFGLADLTAVVRIVRERRVDVLGVQELTPIAVAGLRAAGLEQLLPYATLRPAPSARGAGMWSRFPATAVPHWSSTFEGAAADVMVDGIALRLRVLHPPPPSGALVRTWQRNYDGFVEAARRETPGYVLLLGDFNASVHHRRLRELMGSRWRDAGAVAGAGLVRTWGPRVKLLDPDHVLVDQGMGVAGFEVVSVRGSDHRAVIATVVLATRP